ncbi:Transcriptional regulator, TetR family, associated with agmatine catabolism [Vibrio chagasii]|nr:Transcriptional regulator, TetR family, associated with agmatine catabolism [Vibrio chagasii]
MRKETTKERLERIRAAALSLASKRDVQSISMYDISKEAAISSSTIYHHFPNIEALMRDLMDLIFRDFEGVLRAAVVESEIKSWHDINRMIENSFVRYYTDTPMVQNILFGFHSYSSVRSADASNDLILGEMVSKIYQRYFVLPELPQHVNIFAVALQIADKVYSMDFQDNGGITDVMAEEAVVATEAYLSAYLPRYLPKVC